VKLARCFDADFDVRQSYSTAYLGIRAIPVSRIVGTVDRCGEIRENFTLIRKKHSRQEAYRAAGARKIADVYKTIDPITARRYDGWYYVVDGHRRTAAAKALGVAYLDADVTEYLFGDREDLVSGSRLRMEFERESGLSAIVLANTPGYRELLEDLRRYAGEAAPVAVARKWRGEVFIPACRQIAESELPQWYPDLAEADIYALIVGYHREHIGGIEHWVSFGAYLSSYIFAHTPSARSSGPGRTFRRFLLNLVLPSRTLRRKS
jgi:hypothetical protein